MHFNRPSVRKPELNLIPMINVIFLLLIFFIVAGKFNTTESPQMDPPVASQVKEEGEAPPVRVYLHQDGSLAVNGDTVSRHDFGVIIEAALSQHKAASPSVVITADSTLDSRTLVWAMETIKKAGGQAISLVTRSVQ